MAKTCGRTHSLFNTDDTNLYPLISCDPKATRSAAAAAGGNANPFHQVWSIAHIFLCFYFYNFLTFS